MDDALLTAIFAWLEEQPLADVPLALLFAACEGEAALATELGNLSTSAPPRQPPGEVPEPAGAYLQSVAVTGFRGIGPSVTLPITPG